MNLIVKIAWRNIWRHKGKSLVIGSILFFGALIMTVGNGVISGMDRGLRTNIVEGFTGDAVIISEKQESDNVFLEMMGKAVEPVYNYRDIKPALQKLGYVDRFLPAGKNSVMVLSSEASNPGFTLPIGVDFAEYRKVFPGVLKPVEGRLFEPGERGVLLTTAARKEFCDYSGVWAIPEGCSLVTANLDKDAKADSAGLLLQDSIVFMGMSAENSTSDIRLGIKGIVKYRALDRILGHFSVMDIESYRQCLGYLTAGDRAVNLSSEVSSLLASDESSLDAMFGSAGPAASATEAVESPAASTDTTAAAPVSVEDGAYNVIMTFFKDGVELEKGVKRLNTDLKAANLGVRAVTWKKAFGVIGSMAAMIKAALFVFVMFLFFVAIIIIVNTLSMAALERTNEIGMMRAVGARRGFISAMFFGETAMLSFFFGGTGIVAGLVLVNILSAFHITSTNDMVQLFFGGDTFAPLLGAGDLIAAVVQLTLVTLIAMVYPIIVARSITPLDAVSRE